MLEISERLKRIHALEKAQRRIVFPEGTIRLDSGDPDFSTPAHISEAAYKAMKDNFTHYGSAYGDEELREAICFSIKRDYGVDRKPENVLITAGGTEALHLIAATYVNRGDEVLVLDPDYSAYAEAAIFYGGKPVFAPKENNFHIDMKKVESRISPRTKMIFFSNPCNPTGTILTEKEVMGLTRIAINNNLLLVVDEVYHKLIYDNIKFLSVCQNDDAKDRIVLVNSFSKTYAMTGWRAGYIVADAKIIRDLVKLQKEVIVCVNMPTQKACVAALLGPQDCVESMKNGYDRRRKLVRTILDGIDRISVGPCEGAFYYYPRFESRLSSKELTSYLSDKKIMVRSGTEYGERGQKHIRITFATSIEMVEEGLSRLKNALNELD